MDKKFKKKRKQYKFWANESCMFIFLMDDDKCQITIVKLWSHMFKIVLL